MVKKTSAWLPDRQDIIWIDCNPQAGKEMRDVHPFLVQDWWKDGQTQRIVKAAVEEVLDQDLPESYDRITFKEKSDNVFDLIVSYHLQRMVESGRHNVFSQLYMVNPNPH